MTLNSEIDALSILCPFIAHSKSTMPVPRGHRRDLIISTNGWPISNVLPRRSRCGRHFTVATSTL